MRSSAASSTRPSPAPRPDPAPGEALTGLAHVAAVSFLATRAAPFGYFWVGLAGGLALSRAAWREGARAGYGAAIAAMLQTVAVLGPARFSGPLTHALCAPLIGALERRGRPVWVQVAAASAVRLAHYAVLELYFIFIITGGLDAFAGSYDRLFGWLLPEGPAAALIATLLVDTMWATLFTVLHVRTFRRALWRWDAAPAEPVELTDDQAVPPADEWHPRVDPRVLALVAAVLFGALLASTAWAVLGTVVLVLLVATAITGGDRSAVGLGLGLAAFFVVLVMAFGLTGGVGLEESAQRAVRAGLLVVVATWLRAAAGADGLRDLGRGILHRARFLPAAPEAAVLFGRLDPGPRLVAGGRGLISRLRAARKRPNPLADAVISWVAAEAAATPDPDRSPAPAEAAPRPRSPRATPSPGSP